jgi:pyruvate dehydrogenase E1 component beta subunit
LFASIPGLKVVAASSPADAYGLLKAAIRDDGPVLFIEHRGMYLDKGEVREDEYVEPLGVARKVREGSDVTIVSWLRGVRWAEQAADRLADDGISAEIIDLRSLSPWDADAVEASARKTGKVAILHEAIRTGGFGAEVASTVHERLGPDVAVRRFGAQFVPMPAAAPLQPYVQPSIDDVVTGVHKLLDLSASVSHSHRQ